MLKKNLFLSICFCTFFLISGCTKDQTASKPVNPNPSTQVPVTQQPTDTPAVSKPKILDSAVPVANSSNLSYLPNTIIEENSMQQLQIFQDKLLLSYAVYDNITDSDCYHLKLLSLDTGTLLYETEFSTSGSYAVSVQICNDQIAVSDPSNGLLHIFDETLTELDSYEAVGDLVFVDAAISKAYCLTSSTGIHVLDLKTHTEQILLEQARDLSFYSRSDNTIGFHYIDLSSPGEKEYYAGLHLDTGALNIFQIDDSFSNMICSDTYWSGKYLSQNNMYFLGTQENPMIFPMDDPYLSMEFPDGSSHLLLTTTDENGSQTLFAYDTTGAFLSSCSLQELSATLFSLTWDDHAQGYFLTLINETGLDQLYFWDLSVPVSGEDLSLQPYEKNPVFKNGILEQSYYDRARTLSDHYQVTIKIADQCPLDYVDKTITQELDPQIISTGLDILEQALSRFPDHFFQQLTHGSYRTLEIHLTGTIANKEYIEGYQPTAFVQHENGIITMVLNITDLDSITLEQNIYHETSHIIDHALEHDALYREDALYSETTWASLNPAEFVALNPENGGYYGSYEMLPMEYYQESFTPYFVYDYGKSFPTEDRAILFESAMMGTLSQFSAAEHKPLYDKLAYYCQCIRDSFDTFGWPEHTSWETALDK